MNILDINHLHQGYNIPDKYKLWKRGGYASIYKHNNNILKVLPKYELYDNEDDEENFEYTLNTTSLTEAVISTYLPRNSYFINCKTIYTSDRKIIISQTYKGITLNDLKNNSSDEYILKCLPIIISHLLNICIFLEIHGIFYSDIKLCNLLWDGEKLYLIDYNCISFQILYNNKLIRTKSVGTWMYASPELIFSSKLCKKSTVWSIGMIICELLNDYPINNVYYPKYNTLINTQQNWDYILSKIYSNERKNNTAFINSYKHIPSPWIKWVKKMICWNPNNRISKIELLHEINIMFNLTPIQIVYNPTVFAYPYNNTKSRRELIDLIYNYAVSTNQVYKVCNTIYIFDSYSSQIHLNNENKCLCAAWNIASIFVNEYTFHDEENDQLCKLLSIDDYTDVYKYIWKICEFSDWNLYQKSTDIFIYEYYNDIDMNHFIKFYANYIKPYCSFTLFNDYVKNNSPSYLKK